MKNAIMKVTFGPMVSFYHIILYLEKVTSYEKFSHNLTLKVKTVWKISAFQCY